MILGLLTILKKCQASSKFELVNSTWLSNCQRHVRPIFVMKWRPRAFYRVSTWPHFKENSFASDIGVRVRWVPSRLLWSREAGPQIGWVKARIS